MPTSSNIRPPTVAGRFYPDNPEQLRADIRSYLSPKTQKISALGCIVPHAGYVYSGHVAGAVFARLEIPQTCLLLCPNHTGRGEPLAIMSSGTWKTPLGEVPIDEELAANLKRQFPLLREDSEAHRDEHAIEVELPFLQVLRPDVQFVPICIGTRHLQVLQALGKMIAQTLAQKPEPVLIVASSDMNHYENDAITRVKDGKAIEKILVLDAAGLFETATSDQITMCGLGPAVTLLTAAVTLGAKQSELTKYATSADVSGDRQRVVGYAGIAITK